MRRREFIILLGGAAAAWPLAARAQQPERMRRIGVLMSTAADDPEGQARIAAFLHGLQQLGWTDGRNVRDRRSLGSGDAERSRKYAAELVALAPDVILALVLDCGVAATGNPHRADRIRAGRRSGRRWLRREPGAAGRQRHRFYLLRIRHEREMAGAAQSRSRRGVTRVAVLRDPADPAGTGQWGAIQSVAPSFGVELTPDRRARSRRDRARRHCIRARRRMAA